MYAFLKYCTRVNCEVSQKIKVDRIHTRVTMVSCKHSAISGKRLLLLLALWENQSYQLWENPEVRVLLGLGSVAYT